MTSEGQIEYFVVKQAFVNAEIWVTKLSATYDSTKDAFIPPKQFNSWVLNEETCLWEPPVEYPIDGKMYRWNEEIINWIEIIETPID